MDRIIKASSTEELREQWEALSRQESETKLRRGMETEHRHVLDMIVDLENFFKKV